jgi:hypothetical protein
MAALGLTPALGTAAAPATPLSVTRWMGALQAQDYGSGVWSIGVRSGLTLAEIEQAVVDRQIVRTWPMRGTIHWVPAEDARWMCELLAPRVLASLGPRYAQLGITPDEVEKAGVIFEEYLGEPMSRPDVLSLLADHGIDPSGQRTYHLVGHHCMTGLLCQGPLAGKQPTFVLIDQWVPLSRKPSREEAMTTVIERYLRSHGPATERDIAGWIAGTLAFVREALELIGDRVTRQDVGGQAWLSHVDAPAAGDGPGGVHLLPQWDEFLLGFKSRDVTLPDEHVVKVVPGRNLVFQPTVVVDGEVAGVWKRQASTDGKDGKDRKNTVVLEVTPLTRLTAKALRGLEASSAAYGRFLGRDVELRLVED